MKAMVYIIIDSKAAFGKIEYGNVDEHRRLIDAIESELNDGDEYTVIQPGTIVASLDGTTESDAMKFARIVRNAFQRNNFSNRESTIRIGVLLHERQANDSAGDLIHVARNLSKMGSNKAGNVIESFVLPE